MYSIKELTTHLRAYLILVAILAGHSLAYFYWGDSRLQQQLLILSLATAYFIWGVVTHLKSDHITRTVILEYLGIATLGGLLLLLLTF